MTEDDLGNRFYKKVVVDGKILGKWVRLSKIEEYDADENIIRVLDGSVFLGMKEKYEVLKPLIKYDETLKDYEEAGHLIHESTKTVFIDKSQFILEEDGRYSFEISTNDGNAILFFSNDEETFYTLDERGNPVMEERVQGSKRHVSTTEYEYDLAGKTIFTHTTFSGCFYDTVYEYDDKGNCVHKKTGNNRDLIEFYFDFDENGKIFHATSEERRLSYREPHDEELSHEYNDKGHLCHTKRCIFQRNGIVAESHTWYDYEYDENGKIKRRFTFIENKF